MQPTSHRISWSNPRVLATLLLVFLSGAAAGALALRLATHHRATPGPVLTHANRSDMVAKFQHELDLTPEQVGKLDIILDDYMKYMHDLQAQMDDVRAHGKEMILKILTDEQRTKFDKALA